MNKLKRDSNRFAFMEKYDLESEEDLFQIEVDALEAIAPEQFKDMVLQCVDEFFDKAIHKKNVRNRGITPTAGGFKEIAMQKTINLLASLERD